MNKFLKKLKILLFSSLSLMLFSCEAMREFSSGFNESNGNCQGKRAETWSNVENEWKKGLYVKSSLSEDQKENIKKWAREKNAWYARNASVGRYSEKDPYTEKQYQFRVYCQ